MHKWIIIRFANDSFSGGYATKSHCEKTSPPSSVGRDPRSQRDSRPEIFQVVEVSSPLAHV